MRILRYWPGKKCPTPGLLEWDKGMVVNQIRKSNAVWRFGFRPLRVRFLGLL
jgi:hypothetical protein